MPDAGAIGNPFAVLTAVVAPAILTNACSVLALGTSNRIARVVDRTRFIGQELATLEPHGPRFGARIRQLARLRERANMLVKALRMFYLGMGCFAAAALLTVVGSAASYFRFDSGFHLAAGVALIVGLAGVGGLVYGSSLTVRETRLAFALLDEEVEEVLKERSGVVS